MTDLIPAALTPSSPSPLPEGPSSAQRQTAEAVKEFEALVLTELLRPLFESVETPGIAGGGPGEAVYGALLQEQYAAVIADQGGVGIADSVQRALLEQQFTL